MDKLARIATLIMAPMVGSVAVIGGSGVRLANEASGMFHCHNFVLRRDLQKVKFS